MRTFIYIIWIAIPVLYLLITLWSFLETKGKGQKDKYVRQQLKQFAFVFGSVALSVIVEMFLLDTIHSVAFDGFLERDFLLIFVLPIIMYAMSLAIGPTKEIKLQHGSSKGRSNRKRQ